LAPGIALRAGVPARSAQTAKWFGPTGCSVPRDSIEIDVRVGGHLRFVMTGPDVRSPVDTMFTEVVENELLAGEMEAAGVPGVAGPVRVHLRHKNESNAVRWTCFCVKGLRCGRRGRVRAGHGSAGPG